LAAPDPAPVVPAADPQSVLFTPITSPLTVGGTTFAFGVAASADAGNVSGRLWLSAAALAYAVVTGVTLYLSGHVERRISAAVAAILDRIAGILLTSIAVVLLTNGFTDLIQAALRND
jgi:multiple antibiotic resistance protein